MGCGVIFFFGRTKVHFPSLIRSQKCDLEKARPQPTTGYGTTNGRILFIAVYNYPLGLLDKEYRSMSVVQTVVEFSGFATMVLSACVSIGMVQVACAKATPATL